VDFNHNATDKPMDQINNKIIKEAPTHIGTHMLKE